MGSSDAQIVVETALRAGRALLKVISPNDSGATRSHQSGIYLPTSSWRLFTPHPPERGVNRKHPLTVHWPGGTETESMVTWYGASKREYRLTKFGRGFPFLRPEAVGDLFVLVPMRPTGEPADGVHSLPTEATAFILTREEEVADVCAALGVEVGPGWAIFERGAQPETAEDCLGRHFAEFAASLTEFPRGDAVAAAARRALAICDGGFVHRPLDDRLTSALEAEYRLYRQIERRLCGDSVRGPFNDIDVFVSVAMPILQRRKARAGKSLEYQVATLLEEAGVPFEFGSVAEKDPDIVIPSLRALRDPNVPVERVVGLAVKTTCKDRWPQILSEGGRLVTRHLLTVQPGISTAEIDKMVARQVRLIVPTARHVCFAREDRARLMSVEAFVASLRRQLAGA